MKINWIFVLIILLILLFIFIIDETENFTLSQYRLIIVNNKNWVYIHLINTNNGENKIYKIYKNKLII